MGDIAAAWVLQVGNQSLPRLRIPLLDRIAGVVESRVGFFLLLSPFVALVRSPDIEVLTILSSNFTKKIF